MKRLSAAAACAALLAGCATNGSSNIPSTSQANLGANKLQVAVGTVNNANEPGPGLNVVATLRQPNGTSGVLADQPSITGPAGFTVPATEQGAYGGSCGAAGFCPTTKLVNGVPTPLGGNVDDGTASITASPQVPRSNEGLVNSTLGTFTGVFSYGFGPFNCDQSCSSIGAYYPGNPTNTPGNGFTSSYYQCSSVLCATQPVSDTVTTPQPIFDSNNNAFGGGNAFPYVVGAPIVPFYNNGTFPSGFAGYSPGFTTFQLAPVAGAYTLSVLAPAANTTPVTYTANATLSSTAVLPAITLGPITETAGGGLSGTVTVPAGVTESEIFIVDIRQNVVGNPGAGFSQVFYTVGAAGGGPLTGTGAVAWALPGNLGPCHAVNCQTSSSATPSIQTGDTYFAVAVGYDYPAFEAGPPGNTQQTPTIAGANGQADMTISTYAHATY